MIDREKLKAMAVARMAKDCAASAAALAPQPAEPGALPPPPGEPAPPAHGRRRPPATPRRIPGPGVPTDWVEYLTGPKAMVRVNKNTYRVSRPRDWNPESPISFVSVQVGARWDYIGLIRPPGPFMWGRKSLISASDMRVILFDEFYASVRDPNAPRNDDLEIERL